MDTVNNLIKFDMISEKSVHWSAKIILFLLLIGPVVVALGLCFYLFKRYSQKKFKKESEKYDDLESQRSDTSEFSEPIFESNLKKIKAYKDKRSELKSDHKGKPLNKIRKTHDTNTYEADVEYEDEQRARFYKEESKKWKKKYNRLKQKIASINESNQDLKMTHSKKNEEHDRSKLEKMENDKKKATNLTNNARNLTTCDESKAVGSESATLSDFCESDHRDQNQSF